MTQTVETSFDPIACSYGPPVRHFEMRNGQVIQSRDTVLSGVDDICDSAPFARWRSIVQSNADRIFDKSVVRSQSRLLGANSKCRRRQQITNNHRKDILSIIHPEFSFFRSSADAFVFLGLRRSVTEIREIE